MRVEGRSRPVLRTRTVRMVEVVMDGRRRPGADMRGPDDVAAILEPLFAGKDRETFVRVDLNARHVVVAVEVVSVGSLNASIVHPREVFKGALLNNAAAIIVAHNHPSGEMEPSEEDLSITGKLRDAGELLGVAVLDHLVFGQGSFTSMRTRASGGWK